MYKLSWLKDLDSENLQPTTFADMYATNMDVTLHSYGLQPRSFEGFFANFAGNMVGQPSQEITNMGLLANMIWGSQLTSSVVITSYDVDNSLFQWLFSWYLQMRTVTSVSDEVWCPTVPDGYRLGVVGLRTTTSATQNVKFALPSTTTTLPDTNGVFSASPTSGWPEVDGAVSGITPQMGYTYATSQETLDAYQEWATNPSAPTLEWPATIMRLTGDGFVFEPDRQLSLYARPSITVLPCQPELIGFYQPLESSGSYGIMYAKGKLHTSNIKLHSFISQDAVLPTSSVSDAYPFNLLEAVYGHDVKQSKPIVFGSCFNADGVPYNYFVSGHQAQRSDRTLPSSPYTKLTDPETVCDVALGWMMSPNQLLYWGNSDAGNHLSGVPIANAVGFHGELNRMIPLPNPAGLPVPPEVMVKFGVKVSSSASQGASNVIDFETSSVNGKLIVRNMGEQDSILAIGGGLGMITRSGFIVATGRTNKFGSVGWTS